MAERFRHMSEESIKEFDAAVKKASPRLTKVQLIVPFALVALIAGIAITQSGDEQPRSVPNNVAEAANRTEAPPASRSADEGVAAPIPTLDSGEQTPIVPGEEVDTNMPSHGKGADIAKGQDLARGAGGPAVSGAQYDLMSPGMTLITVRGLLGAPGTEVTSESMKSEGSSAYTWDGPNSGSSITAVFAQDRLLSKSQFGLK